MVFKNYSDHRIHPEKVRVGDYILNAFDEYDKVIKISSNLQGVLAQITPRQKYIFRLKVDRCPDTTIFCEEESILTVKRLSLKTILSKL